MDFRITPEEEAFRKEVREFLDKELPKDWPGVDPDLYHEDAFDNIHEVSLAMQKKLAAKGWLGLTWPKKYGGHEQPLWKQIILEEEMTYRGSPGLDPYQFVGGMGDLLLDFGTEAQRIEVPADDGPRRDQGRHGHERAECRLRLGEHPVEG